MSNHCSSLQIWKVKVPSKVKILVWLVALGKVNTCDQVQRRLPFTCFSPHWCILCKSGEENVSHVFLHCPFSIQLWWKLLKEVGLCWVTPKGCFELLSTKFDALGKGRKAKALWGSLLQAIFWNIWLERNKRVFEVYKGAGVEELWDRVRHWAALWASVSIEFRVIGETITFVAPEGQTFLSNGEWIRYLIIARMLRLIRLLMYVQRYRAFVATFLTLIPSLMPYLGTIFCVMCIYCTLGVQIFGGIVNDGNALLEGSELYENDYLLFNFNDYPNGMVTLFNLLVMGNWHLWMEGYQEITGNWWSVVYFVSFYLVTAVLLLNLVMAFVLEAFFAEMDLELSEKCEEEEGAKDRPRSLGSKTQSQRIDVLLHHMLSSELTQRQPSNAA